MGLDGVLVVDKPAGPTSHDVVALVRRLAGTRRVGHGGTLDPFASGVLPLFLGRATRLVEYHLGARKAYRATVCFGASSTTDDLEGELTPAAAPAPDQAAVGAALVGLRGPQRQRPPAFSALKVGGRRAYALARAGEPPDLPDREVTLHRLELAEWDASDPERPIAVLDVECSAGTYVRALARDLGAAVGNAAYLGGLDRTASGSFRLADAVRLDQVRAAAAEGLSRLNALLLPIDAGLGGLPRIELSATDAAAIVRGQFIRPPDGLRPAEDAPHVRLVDESGRLVAIGGWRGGRLAPEKVLVDPPAPASRDGLLEGAAASERDPSAEADPDPVSPDDA